MTPTAGAADERVRVDAVNLVQAWVRDHSYDVHVNDAIDLVRAITAALGAEAMRADEARAVLAKVAKRLEVLDKRCQDIDERGTEDEMENAMSVALSAIDKLVREYAPAQAEDKQP